MRATRTLIVALLVFVILSVSVNRSVARAAPNGKTSTAELAGGLGLLYFLAKYAVDAHKTAGSVSQAAKVMTAYPDETNSLVVTRDRVLYAVATFLPAGLNDSSDVKTQKSALRRYFEDLRACWNQVIVTSPSSPPAGTQGSNTPASGAPRGQGGEPGGAAHAAPAVSPTPKAAEPQPPSCDAVIHDDLHVIPAGIDQIDLAASLKNAPSVMEETIDQRVGSFDADNLIRAQFLQAVGADFLNKANPAGAGGAPTVNASKIPLTSITDVYTNCYGKLSPIDCISSLGTLETQLATAHNQRAVCEWAKFSWMPTYSAITRTWKSSNLPKSYTDGGADAVRGDIERINFGAAPNC